MGEFYGELRVDNGLRRIKVNDNGDFIQISVNDKGLFQRFADLLSWVDKKQDELSEYSSNYTEKLKAETEQWKAEEHTEEEKEAFNEKLSVRVTGELMAMQADLYKEVCVRLDTLFGAGTCRKVFGDVIPDELLVMDFLDQLTPILERLGRERNEKLKLKYNRNRRGANSIKALPGKGV